MNLNRTLVVTLLSAVAIVFVVGVFIIAQNTVSGQVLPTLASLPSSTPTFTPTLTRTASRTPTRTPTQTPSKTPTATGTAT